MTKAKIIDLPKEQQQELNEMMPKPRQKEDILKTYEKQHPKKFKERRALYEKLADEEIARDERLLKNSTKTARTPETMQDLEQLLKAEGQLWRDENTKVNENTGEIKVPKMPARTIANILEKHLKTTVLGKDKKEADKSLPYFYDLDEGIYVSFTRTLEQLCLKIEPRAKIAERREAIEYIRLEAPINSLTEDETKIVCNNGIYNTQTQQLEPFNPKYFFTAKIQTNYNPDAEEPIINGWSVSNWFKEIAGDVPDKLTLLWQLVASTINSNYLQPVAFFLIDDGQGRTGKGTFQELLISLVGLSNYASLKFIDFQNDFKLAQAMGSALIIGDDNDPTKFYEDNSNFRTMVTGDPILINPKGLRPYSAQSRALIVQSMNGRPKLPPQDEKTTRRFRIIKFNHQYKDTPEGRKIKSDYIKRPEVLEWILKEAVKIDITSLADTSESEEEVKKIHTENDPVAYFMETYFNELKSSRIPVAFLFKFFQATQRYETGRLNSSSMTQRGFTRKLNKLLPAGWKYERKSMYVGDFWNHDDIKTIIKYSPEIGHSYYEATKDQPRTYCQALIYRE